MIYTETFVENILVWLKKNGFTAIGYYAYRKPLPFGYITVHFDVDNVIVCLDANLINKRFSCKRMLTLYIFQDKELTDACLTSTLFDICYEYNKKCLFEED